LFPPGLSRIQEVNPDIGMATNARKSQPLIMETEETKVKKKPEFNLYRDNRTGKLSAKVRVPGTKSGRELTLDVGEDRLILDSDKYFLDIFLPLRLDGSKTSARFIPDQQILSVEMLIVD
jgi:hypothetical protein